MSASVPKSIVRRVVTEAVQHAPEILEAIGKGFRALGYELDLGPMTPDARKHFGAVDDRIAADLDELEQRDAHDTDRAPPRESER